MPTHKYAPTNPQNLHPVTHNIRNWKLDILPLRKAEYSAGNWWIYCW